MRWRTTLAMTTLLSLVLGLLCAPAAARPGRLGWGPCPFDVGTSDAQCATVRVPMDHRHPEGRKIDIHISRVRSPHPDKRRGTLIINEGGPGAHLADASRFHELVPAAVLDAYDVVSFDQRGFGHSAPIRCGLAPEDQYTFPWPMAGGEPAVRARAQRVAQRCAERAGADLPHVGTASVARDVDQIRRALGEDRISFLGVSYGSYLGAAYDSMFPGRVDRLLLDSNVDPTVAWRGTLRDAFTNGVEVRFTDFADFAAEHRAEYGLGADRPEVQRTFLDLVDRLDRAPMPTPNGRLAGMHLRISLFGAMFDDAAFPVFARLLKAARAGDAATAATTAAELGVFADDDNDASAELAVFCADGTFPRSPAVYAADARADATAFPLSGGTGGGIWPCVFWPSDPIDPPVRVSDRGRPNVLLTNNLRDPATTYAAAQALRRQFGDRARLVGVQHGGHGAVLYSGNACVRQVGADFLVHGARPAADFVCPATHSGLRGALEHLTTVDGAPGALAEVRDSRGTAVLSSGVADVRTGRALRADDRVRIFSNTKTFVATVVLQLNAGGRVDLDAPVERYLPGLLRANGNDGREITVRQLLQHTGGLPDFDSDVFAPGGYRKHRLDHHTPAELVATATRQPRLSVPGKEFHYSTTNYVVAGMIIEAVTGHRYADEVRTRILAPLGLRHTTLPGDYPMIAGRHARGYAHLDANQQISDRGTLIDVTVLNSSLLWAGGELVSTVSDLNTFFAALLGGRLLPPAQLAQMMRTEPADLFPGARYGLGLISVPLSCGGEYWTHGGSGLGYTTRQGTTMDGRQVSIVHTTSPPTRQLAEDTVSAVDTALCEAG